MEKLVKAVVLTTAFFMLSGCSNDMDESDKWVVYESKLFSLNTIIDSLILVNCDSQIKGARLCEEMKLTQMDITNRKESIPVISKKKHDQEASEIIEADLQLVINRAESDIQYYIDQLKK